MRTIKFRGKDKDDNWVQGDLIHGVGSKKERYYILPNVVNLYSVKNCHPLDGVEVKPESIGQFTGLTDANGVEIYEGDICKYKTITGRISWDQQGCSFVLKLNEGSEIAKLFYRYRDLSATFSDGLTYQCDYLEVIGNTTENPEML